MRALLSSAGAVVKYISSPAFSDDCFFDSATKNLRVPYNPSHKGFCPALLASSSSRALCSETRRTAIHTVDLVQTSSLAFRENGVRGINKKLPNKMTDLELTYMNH